MPKMVFVIIYTLMVLGFELRTSCVEADSLLLEPCLQPLLFWLFWI
jgi:hypothetical protein